MAGGGGGGPFKRAGPGGGGGWFHLTGSARGWGVVEYLNTRNRLSNMPKNKLKDV